MKFLLRAAFWLSIVILLLPGGPSHEKGGPQIGASDAVSAASATVTDLRQFCNRQPDACAVGSQAFNEFGHKAQASFKWLYETLNERFGQDQNTSSVAGPDRAAGMSALKPNQQTLTPTDVAPPWRSPVRREAAGKHPA
jgi:hypothetical protein